MRSKDALLRLHRVHRFQFEEKRRQVAEIETMMADFRRKQDDLDRQIEIEEAKNGVTDPNHFNYSMTAKSIRNRRDNLLRSLDDLARQLEGARGELDESEAELRKVELQAEKVASVRGDSGLIGKAIDETAQHAR